KSILCGDALGYKPCGGVIVVVLHGQTPLLVTGDPVVASKPHGAAVLGTDNGIAARGEERHPARAIPAGIVARPWAAMGMYQCRQCRIALLPAGGQVQDRRNGPAIARGIGNPALLAD